MADSQTPSASHQILDILILGQDGSGKSSTGNSILLKKAFKTSQSSSYRTVNIHSVLSEYLSTTGMLYTIRVTDGPSLDDIDLTRKRNSDHDFESIEKVVSECPNGFHVIVITVRMGFPFTYETCKLINSFENLVGSNYLDEHGIVVVTGGEDLVYNDDESGEEEDAGDGKSSFEAWRDRQPNNLQMIFNKCKNRVVLFKNKAEDHSFLVEQLEKFLDVVGEPKQSKWTVEIKLSILQWKIFHMKSVTDVENLENYVQDLGREIESTSTVCDQQSRSKGRANSIDDKKQKSDKLKRELQKLKTIFENMKNEQAGEEVFQKNHEEAMNCIKCMLETPALRTEETNFFSSAACCSLS